MNYKFNFLSIAYSIYTMLCIGLCEKEEWGCFDLRVKCNNPQCDFSAYDIANVPSYIHTLLSCQENEAVYVTSITYYLPSTWDNYCINQTSCAATTYDDHCVCCTMPSMPNETCTFQNNYSTYPCGYFSQGSCLFNVSRIQFTTCETMHIFDDEDAYGSCGSGSGYCFSRWVQVNYECHTVTTVLPPSESVVTSKMSKAMLTSETMVITDRMETPKGMVTSEAMVTTEGVETSKGMVTFEAMVTNEGMVTNKGMVTYAMVTTEGMVTNKGMVTFEAMVTTEGAEISKGIVTCEAMVTTEGMVTNKGLVTTKVMVASEPMVSTEGMVITKGIVPSESVVTPVATMTTEFTVAAEAMITPAATEANSNASTNDARLILYVCGPMYALLILLTTGPHLQVH